MVLFSSFHRSPIFSRCARCREEAVILLTKSRSSKARPQNKFQLWPQYDIRNTSDLSSRKDAIQSLTLENPCQASGAQLHLPGTTRNPDATHTGTSTWKDLLWDEKNKQSSRKHRLHLNATSLKIPVPKHRETDCSPRRKKLMTSEICCFQESSCIRTC